MKPPRLARPAPRTLAAAPPAPVRSPQAAARPTAFPALAAALAGGVVLPACESPQCGTSRADELERHGRAALRANRAGDSIHEIGVALGLVAHGTTRVDAPAGAVRPVTTTPQPPPRIDPTPIRTAGQPVRVDLTPPTPPTPPPPAVDPTPPLPPTSPHASPDEPTRRSPGRPPMVQPHPPRSPARGGVRSIDRDPTF
jgi:hypothetical protein